MTQYLPEVSSVYMWIVFAIIIVAMISYAFEKIPIETTSLLVILSLLLLFHLPLLQDTHTTPLMDTSDILSGFSSPALISIIALIVIGQGLFYSGALETMTNKLNKLAHYTPLLTITIILLTAMIMSAFLNNTPVVLMTIPIITTIARKHHTPLPSVMMPLSFLCILGGMTTLLGSSTNLLVAGIIAESHLPELSFFSITIPGLFLAIIGAIYVLFIMPYMLKHVRSPKENTDTEQPDISGKQYIFEIFLQENNHLIGTQSIAGIFPEFTQVTLRMVKRYEDTFFPPFDNFTLQARDIVVFTATRPQLTQILSQPEHLLNNLIQRVTHSDDANHLEQSTLAEIVISPGSRMIGQTIYQINFLAETNCHIIGIQRHHRMLRKNLSDVKLNTGDVLLVCGTPQNIQTLPSNRNILLLEWSQTQLPNFAKAWHARIIFMTTVLLVAFNIVPIVTAAIGGAVMMILLGILNILQAIRGVDLRIFFTIATALAMSKALVATGGSSFLVLHFVSIFNTTPLWLTLSAFFLLCAIVTNILTNNATALLFTPIAIGLAEKLSVAPEAFVFAVIFASNCSFATPIAYQTNLLVMGPGNYQFRDFIYVGVPLIILLWIAYTCFAPWYFNLM